MGAAKSQEVEGFQKVGLAYTISPQDKIDLGRKSEIQFLEVPESVNGCRQNPQISRRPDAGASTGRAPRFLRRPRSGA